MIICKICNLTMQGNGYCANHGTGGSAYKIMTQEEIIKQELAGSLSIYAGKKPYVNNGISYGEQDSYEPVVVVSLDKLASFLAKHLDIKAEDLISPSLKEEIK